MKEQTENGVMEMQRRNKSLIRLLGIVSVRYFTELSFSSTR